MRISVCPVRTLPIKYFIIPIVLLLSFAAFSVSTDIAVAPSVHAQSVEDLMPVAVAGTSTVTVVQPKKVDEPDTIYNNCWLYVKSIYPNLPNSQFIVDNITPHIGAVVFFKYGKLNHYAIITEMDSSGMWVRDSNFGGPGIRTHYISRDNPHIKGYFNPDA